MIKMTFKIVLCLTGSLALTAGVLAFFPWLEGRLNGAIPGLALQFLCLIIWLVSIVGAIRFLIAEIIKGLPEKWTASIYFILFVFMVLPWLLVINDFDAEKNFLSGFGAWVESEVDYAGIDHWAKSITSEGQPDPGSSLWPTEEFESLAIGYKIPVEDWPDVVRRVTPDEVRRLPQGCILLAWEPASPVGWGRYICIGKTECCPPEVLTNHMSLWQSVNSDMAVGLKIHH